MLSHLSYLLILHAAVVDFFLFTFLYCLFMNYMIDMCKSTWMNEWNITEITTELEYFSYYRVHGITALIVHWIRSDYSMPIED